MERDCLISHGGANFLREKLFIGSDKFKVHVCDQCGLIASNIDKNITNKQVYNCKFCNKNSTVSPILIPYATKLLFQELMALQIAPRLKLN